MMTADTAREYLAEYAAITEAGTVYTSVTSVARSGMSRRIRVYVVDNGEIRSITHLVAAFLGYSSDPDRGMLVRGCGMDMGFHVVYSLSRAFHGGRADMGLNDAGYLLTQRWL